jgi:hypothetical protein
MEEENEELEDEEDVSGESSEFRLPPHIPMRLFRLFAPRPLYPSLIDSTSLSFPNLLQQPNPNDNNDAKVSTFLDLLISAPIHKRKMLDKKIQRSGDPTAPSQDFTESPRTIVYLRDFRSILDTSRGRIAHQTLLSVIQGRRRLGERIVLVVSDDPSNDHVSPATFASQFYHIIKIPPPSTEADTAVVQEDRHARIREINLRSIQWAIRQRSRAPSMGFECPVGIHLDASATLSIPGLDKEVWEANTVQRIASIAIGNHGRWLAENKPHQTVPITIADVAQAVEDVIQADKERTERKQERKEPREMPDPINKAATATLENSQLPVISSKDCNKHEQKLLGGVIDPGRFSQWRN